MWIRDRPMPPATLPARVHTPYGRSPFHFGPFLLLGSSAAAPGNARLGRTKFYEKVGIKISAIVNIKQPMKTMS
jgi:hypothetical protein